MIDYYKSPIHPWHRGLRLEITYIPMVFSILYIYIPLIPRGFIKSLVGFFEKPSFKSRKHRDNPPYIWLVVWNMSLMTFHNKNGKTFPLTNSYVSRWLKPPMSDMYLDQSLQNTGHLSSICSISVYGRFKLT